MKKYSKRGFTLSELMAVLAIVAVLAAIAIPTAIHYIRLAEFRKNESNAKTVYLAAESELTWYRTSGQWEQFKKSVVKKGTLNDSYDEAEYEHLKGRKIYAVTLDNKKGTSAGTSPSGELVEALLEDNTYDKDFFNAAITIEIDVDTGQVYSAFYATHCDSLAYDGTDEKDADGVRILNIRAADKNRAYENRRKRFLGYYSVEDVTNVVDMKPVRLKIGSINLVNSETLSLNWSSNSRHDNLDVEFTITFYQEKEGLTGEGKKLFSLTVNRDTLKKEQGWTGTSGQMALLELKDESSVSGGEDPDAGTGKPEKPTQKWAFPLAYQKTGSGQSARFSLVLDGMMSPELMASLEANQSNKDYQKEYGTNITRLESVVPELSKPQDIYAVVEVKPTYKNMSGDTREYRAGSPVKSNVENTMFSKGTEVKVGKLEAKITRFRHLSNIRYYAADEEAVFTLAARNMDWAGSSTGLYDLAAEKKQNNGSGGTGIDGADGEGTGGTGGGSTGTDILTVQWKNVRMTDPDTKKETVLDFPSIPLLSKKHTFKGNKTGTLVSNLHLGNGSMADDKDIGKIYKENADKNYARYLGLFCESEGTIQDVALRNPKLSLTGEGDAPAEEYASLQGVGILCGRSGGTLQDITVESAGDAKDTVVVCLADRTGEKAKEPAGIGGLAGVLAEKEADGTLRAQDDGLIAGITMEGFVSGKLPKPEAASRAGADPDLQAPQKQAGDYPYGIGGIFGYAELGGNVTVEDCRNRASVTGNLFAGGIGGQVKGSYTGSRPVQGADIENCYNDGLILCDEKYAHPDEACELEGRYFGGILGYGSQTHILASSSASGRSEDYRYTAAKKSSLVGQYVGGIIGYGDSCLVAACSTQKDGYILGSDYVGGIAGGLANNVQEVVTGAGEIQVTTNAGYVIGRRYVGGIVGKNSGNVLDNGTAAVSTIKDCVNSGIAAGYGDYIGGIAGYNGSHGEITDCSSYFSDYGNAMLQTIVGEWQATTGNCVGGLAGYNNGTIKFGTDAAATVKSVSSVVVGNDYVGGMIGFNDKDGKLRVNDDGRNMNYSLIGGQVYAQGDGAGGCIGLNASVDVLGQNLEIRPSSVNGRYCVGGFIGANVVDLDSAAGTDVSMSGIRVNNVLGSVSGTAFTGGVIGYQRTYQENQLQGAPASDGETRLLAQLMGKTSADAGSADLLPELADGNLPTAVVPSKSDKRLIIQNENNSGGAAGSLDSANSNIPVIADLYAGGIVGYCEQNSRLVLKDCRNDGNITQKTAVGDASDVSAKVSLKAYLEFLARESGNDGYKNAALELGKEEQENQPVYVSMVGGMIGANLENQVIDHCANKGSMSGFVGLGGIVGLNAGGIFDCELQDNFGNTSLDFIGGIAGLNVKGDELPRTYTDGNYNPGTYTSGTIAACTTVSDRTVFGRSYVGGIAGYNLTGGRLEKNQNQINVTAVGNYAGGIAGANSGVIQAAADTSSKSRTVSGTKGTGIGGIVGWNKQSGEILVAATEAGTGTGNTDEVIAVGSMVSIDGGQKVGGIAGMNEGRLGIAGISGKEAAVIPNLYLTCQAQSVRAREGYAGGIAGESGRMSEQPEGSTDRTGDAVEESQNTPDGTAEDGSSDTMIGQGNIERVRNRSEKVTADKGPAGGIVAVNQSNVALKQCQNRGNVNSDHGYAGGIAAENYGTIQKCSVGNAAGTTAKEITISSRGTEEIGAVCAVNRADAVIQNSLLLKQVTLSGSAKTIGGIAGTNQGTIEDVKDLTENAAETFHMPSIKMSSGGLTVGGAAGKNEGGALIRNLTMDGLEFEGFTNYQYLGGITGINQKAGDARGGNGLVDNCTFSQGRITQSSGGSAGNCYGGIAGLNEGTLRDCRIEKFTAEVQGIYTATSTNTAKEKEDRSSHVGGIAGKNEEDGEITGCLIQGGGNDIQVNNGMAGGIVGYNKGTVKNSGDEATVEEIQNDSSIRELTGHGFSADSDYVSWGNGNQLEDFQYDGSKISVNADRSLSLIMSTNGNVGGITAYNAPTGSVSRCATGDWYLNNKSEAIGVGTGGIIGMNESEKDLSFLLNRAFVGRQLKSGTTDRFAGGIIGNQNNTTAEGWKIANCANYGTVYCLNTHYSGGIIGQWTGTGGNIEKCYNYGNLQTTIAVGWVGASGGIVAQLYHAYEGDEYNIISCRNYGSLYGRNGRSTGDCANDSAGILGNVTAYTASDGGQGFTIQVLDCVNESGVEIYSKSMASGIVGFFSCDSINTQPYDHIEASTRNIKLHIERCRNFASVMKGNNFVGGIFGERYGKTGSENTALLDCYSVDLYGSNYTSPNKPRTPIISYANGTNRINYDLLDSQRNYFFESGSYDLTKTGISDDLKKADTNRAYYYNGAKRYALYIEPGKDASGLSVDETSGVVKNSSGSEIGKVLFEINEDFANMGEVVNKDRNFDQYVRTAYYKVEGVTPGQKIPDPQQVTVSRQNGGDTAVVTVTPQEGTKPFRYTAKLYVGGNEISGKDYDVEFYSNTYSIDLSRYPQAQDGELTVWLQAWSMFEDVAPSNIIKSGPVQGQKMLPNPDIRIELEKGNNGYQYRFSLNEDNKKKFEELKAGGSPFTEYKISVKFMDGTSVELTPGSGLEAVKEMKDSLQQLLVQAEPQNPASSPYAASSQVSVPVYLPGYQPSIRLGTTGSTGTAVPSVSVAGTSVSDLAITVKLDASGSGKITTPPIYRAELIGTWAGGGEQDGKEVVLAETDILTAADAGAQAVFSDLPEGLENAKDLKVRVWYGQSGLGPVYTWHALKDAAGANFCTLKEMKEENGVETPVWEYGYSAVLADNSANGFGDYQWESAKLFEWVGPPVLKDAGTQLKPLENTDKLQYEFSWECTDPAHDHIITLKGITKDADGNESQVSIKVNESVLASAGNKYTADAEDWNYTEVELTAACKGDASKGQIGLSSTGRYLVKQRLPKPEQPLVANQNADELNYTIEWLPVSPEVSGANPDTGCISYDIYAEKYENGTWVKVSNPADSGLPEGVIKNVNVSEKKEDGRYSTQCNLEQYTEGKETRLRIYLVAKAAPDDAQYTDSLEGAAYELTVPARIAPPDVTWGKTWDYAVDNPVKVEDFQAADPLLPGSLKVTVTPNAGSTQTGDSSYLLKAYVLDRNAFTGAVSGSEAGINELKAEVKAAIENNDAQKLAELGIADITYPAKDPASGTLSPVVMDVNADDTYSHTLRGLSAEHAGKWILFYTRMSSGNGQLSSKWVPNEKVWRLPYVKLSAPSVTVTAQERTVEATDNSNPDVPEKETWTAGQTVLQWSNVELSDAYEITLTGTDGNPGTSHTYRIEESTEAAGGGADGQKRVTVYHKTLSQDGTAIVWEEVDEEPQPGPGEGTDAQQRTFTFVLPGYRAVLDSSYKEAELSIPYHVELETILEVRWEQETGFGYTLILPDTASLKPKEGIEIKDPVRVTSRTDIWSDVKENSREGVQPPAQSEAYVRSEPSTNDFSNQ